MYWSGPAALGGGGDHGRPPRQVAGAVQAGDHDGHRAVALLAAVKQPERLGDRRDSWCSASVTGRSKNHAFGLLAACLRSATVTRPKSSLVAPDTCMYRRAIIATIAAGVARPIG